MKFYTTEKQSKQEVIRARRGLCLGSSPSPGCGDGWMWRMPCRMPVPHNPITTTSQRSTTVSCHTASPYKPSEHQVQRIKASEPPFLPKPCNQSLVDLFSHIALYVCQRFLPVWHSSKRPRRHIWCTCDVFIIRFNAKAEPNTIKQWIKTCLPWMLKEESLRQNKPADLVLALIGGKTAYR